MGQVRLSEVKATNFLTTSMEEFIVIIFYYIANVHYGFCRWLFQGGVPMAPLLNSVSCGCAIMFLIVKALSFLSLERRAFRRVSVVYVVSLA